MFNSVMRACIFRHGRRRSCNSMLSPPSSISILPRHYSISTTSKDDSFTVSYLINTCGLPLKSALSASKLIHFDSPQNPNSVINLFKSYGFSQTQLPKLLILNPRALILNPDKILSPKLQFLQSKGALGLDLVQIVLGSPDLLTRSLENHIIPNYNYIRNFLKSDVKAIKVLKGGHRLFGPNLESSVPPKIKLLQEIGVPESYIVTAFCNHPSLFVMSLDWLKNLLEKTRELGFDPSKSKSVFVQAMIAMKGMKKCTWEKKVLVYKRWGWSSDDILAAFRRSPMCMNLSEDRIMTIMDIFLNKLGLDSSVVAKRPVMLLYSLKKRIIPRASVVQTLLSKNLMVKNAYLPGVFDCTEEDFLKKYVNRHKNEAPQLLKLYKEKLNLAN